MSKRLDLTGQKIGRLTVNSYSHTTEHRRIMWNCTCDCGNTVVVQTNDLRRKHTTSCGCLRRETARNTKWRGRGKIGLSVLNRILHNAKRRCLDSTLTLEDLWQLFLKQHGCCAISGIPLDFATISECKAGRTNTASLDRIDSTKGYTLDNVQWVHKRVNEMKMSQSQEEFIQLCRLIVQHQS